MANRQKPVINSNIPEISNYISNVNNLDSLIKKSTKSNLSNISSDIIVKNENIFSFNKKSIEYWLTIYNDINKKKKDKSLTNKISDTLMKFIINQRRQLLYNNLIKILDNLKNNVLSTKEYNDYTVKIDFIVENLLKFEFLGVCIINLKNNTCDYSLFCYYSGDDNKIESLSKKSNWKILPNSILDLFHSNYRKSWKSYLSLNEDPNNNTENNYTFEIISIIKDSLDIVYKEPFLIPKLLDKNKDTKVLKYDVRYFSKRYNKLINTLTPKQKTKKRSREEESDDDDNTSDTSGDNKEKEKKRPKFNHYSYGFNDGLNLTNENHAMTIEDWGNKSNIVQTNLDLINMSDFKQILSDYSSKKKVIEINSGLIPDMIISGLNPFGIVKNCIRSIGLRRSITVKNDNNEISDIESQILDKSNHEDIRLHTFSHFNSLAIISMLSK